MSRTFRPASLLLVALAALTPACVSTHPTTPAAALRTPVWPPAPDQPRVAYVQSLYSPRDIGHRPSLAARLGSWITGETAERLALQKPFGVALDEAGNLCITDMGAKRLCYCDFARKQWRHYEQAGNLRFASPVAVARRDGVFYLADSQLGKVLAFRDDAKLAWAIGAPLHRPAGLAMAGESLAVVDSQAHCVFVFDLLGQLRFQFGERGLGPGQFNFPTHIAADQAGHFLITDSMNCRVQVFDLHGKFLSQFGSNGDTSGHFGRPKGLAVDSFGHVYVADALFNNLQIFSLQGQFLLNLGVSGAGPGEFALPGGIAIGSENRIYVADGYNRRVQVFKYIGQP
jgi:DNA-binding beta-propeller fold protein YncE